MNRKNAGRKKSKHPLRISKTYTVDPEIIFELDALMATGRIDNRIRSAMVDAGLRIMIGVVKKYSAGYFIDNKEQIVDEALENL